jgi:hypothetical protein
VRPAGRTTKKPDFVSGFFYLFRGKIGPIAGSVYLVRRLVGHGCLLDLVDLFPHRGSRFLDKSFAFPGSASVETAPGIGIGI